MFQRQHGAISACIFSLTQGINIWSVMERGMNAYEVPAVMLGLILIYVVVPLGFVEVTVTAIIITLLHFLPEGVVLEYIGDAMMTVFGAPQPPDGHAAHPVRCALEMRDHLDALNRRWEAQGLARYWKNQGIDQLVCRVGIHTGTVVAGNIGSAKKMKYGAIGDAVNIAARLEQAHKDLGTTGGPRPSRSTPSDAVVRHENAGPLMVA